MATETIDISDIKSVNATPRLIHGDAEFWGPPNFRAKVSLENRGEVIYMKIVADWEEPKGDFTRFRYETERPVYDIRRIKGPGWRFVGFKDQYDLNLDWVQLPGTDRGLQDVVQSDAGLVRVLRAEGDSWGGVFGGADRPKIQIDFNRVYFDITDDR